MNELRQILKEQGIELRGDPISDPSGNGEILVGISFYRDSNGKVLSPTYQSLNQAKEQLLALGMKIKFLLYSDQFLDLEAGLRATLLGAFPQDVRNAFAAPVGPGVVVWIDPKVDRARESGHLIEETISEYFARVKMPVRSVHWLPDVNLPGKVALLKTLRIIAPAAQEQISQALQAKGFVIPSPEWLARTLDKHRKAGDIILVSDLRYALPLTALRSLGSSRNGSSPDISRMLALNKRPK